MLPLLVESMYIFFTHLVTLVEIIVDTSLYPLTSCDDWVPYKSLQCSLVIFIALEVISNSGILFASLNLILKHSLSRIILDKLSNIFA